MIYRDLGKTGARISNLGFGTAKLPHTIINGKDSIDTEKSLVTINRAFELGVNYIDTAPYYCNGLCEQIVGKALKGWRNKIYLCAKNLVEDASGAIWRDNLEKSLRNLDTEYIDNYLMWCISWDTYKNFIDIKDGPMKAVFKAKEEGLIKHISFSSHDTPENLIKLIDTGYYETVLCQYNLLDRRNENVIAHANEKGLGVIIMGPVGGGRLGKPSESIQNLLPKKAVSSAEIALRFVLSNPGVTCALSGMESVEMVEENVKTASNLSPLSKDEIDRINESMNENKRLADLYCIGCGYCMPCPEGVDIPLNFKLMNYHRLYGLTDYARDQYSLIGTNGSNTGKKAEECIKCGICETKCTQNLQIRKQLEETAKILGNEIT